MVYESDFYTVRRPYSRPNITSYSVTVPRISVTTWKVKPSIRTSVLIGELDRIYHRSRPHLSYVPTEDFLNSRPLVDFDDETKSIRAETEKLMKRIYTSVPHPRNTTPLQIVPYYGHYTADKYYSPHHHNTVSEDILKMSHYHEPSARTIGRGHLACVSFAGGRGYPRRKHLYSDENRDIRDEIKVRSYYNKNRAYEDAMSLPTGFASYLLRLQADNRNGTLTSTEKLQITNILNDRKEKNNALLKDVGKGTKELNSNLENKISGYKSNSTDETIIPVQLETKVNKNYSNFSTVLNKEEKEINVSIDETPNHKQNQRKLSITDNVLPPVSAVKSKEKIVEIKVEPKKIGNESEWTSKPIHQASRTNSLVAEKELNIFEPEVKNEDQIKVISEKVISMAPEETQKEPPKSEEIQLADNIEESEQSFTTDNVEKIIKAPDEELSTQEKNDNPEISPESKNNLVENNISSLSQNDNRNENIEEDVSHEISVNIEEKKDVLQDINNEPSIENIADGAETVNQDNEDDSKTIVKELNETVDETVTETTLETIIESSQFTVYDTNETTVTTIETNYNENYVQESTESTAAPEIEHKPNELEYQSPSEITEIQEPTEHFTSETTTENLPNISPIKADEDESFNQIQVEYSTNLSEINEGTNLELEKFKQEEITESQTIEELIDQESPVKRVSESEPLIEEPQSPESDLIYNKNTPNEIYEVLSDVAEEV